MSSDHPDDLAYGICNLHDTITSKNYHTPRRTQECQDDREDIRPGYPTDWVLLQLEFDLRKSSIPIPQCCFYPNAQGRTPVYF